MKRKRNAGVIRVEYSDDGFMANWGDGRTEGVKWSEVERVYTYKTDCYAYDMLWLAFERSGHDESLHIREEAEGFQGLISAMGKAFPEINPQWYFNVMQPPFAENLTLLFVRKGVAWLPIQPERREREPIAISNCRFDSRHPVNSDVLRQVSGIGRTFPVKNARK